MHGDRNTTFFQQKTLTRRRNNKIVAIKDKNEQWLNEVEAIKRHTVQFFSKLYAEENHHPEPYKIKGLFHRIDEDSRTFLQGPTDEMETKNTVFSLKPFKVLGVDGLHAIFYQSQ